MVDAPALIAGYLDETLSPEEHTALAQWLRESPDHQRQFAQAVLLHDRLRGEFLALAALTAPARSAVGQPAATASGRRMRSAAMTGAVAMAVLALLLLWKGIGETPAAAAVVELNRLIVANAQATDRTYRITVEEAVAEPQAGKRPEAGRPPKPPMDGAVLHVRGGHQFVLIRTTSGGAPFITGSNGRTSWAVRPDGPVRVSADLSRFNRDLPGHEHAMPLINIEEGLERVRAAYDVQLLPIENPDAGAMPDERPLRLLVAVKRRGQRGPRRVEITYVVATGQIRELRFVDMPYGPDRLTLRLSLVEERDLGRGFFDHAAHHDPVRPVELEE